MHPELLRALAVQADRDRLTITLRDKPRGHLTRWLRKLGNLTVETGADRYDTDAAPLPEEG
jgi:hypothetical protein